MKRRHKIKEEKLASLLRQFLQKHQSKTFTSNRKHENLKYFPLIHRPFQFINKLATACALIVSIPVHADSIVDLNKNKLISSLTYDYGVELAWERHPNLTTSRIPVAAMYNADEEDRKAFSDLSFVVTNAKRIETVVFSPPCFKCREKDVTVSDVLRSISHQPVSEKQKESIKKILVAPGTYIFGLRKPCGPFIADRGFLFENDLSTAILLLSSNCKAGRLIGKYPSPYYLFNLDPQFDRLIRINPEFFR